MTYNVFGGMLNVAQSGKCILSLIADDNVSGPRWMQRQERCNSAYSSMEPISHTLNKAWTS